MRQLRPWLLVFLLMPLVALGPILFSGKTIGPFDQVAKMVPGAPAASSTQAWDILTIDGVLQFYPWRDLVFQGWRSGEVPLWNPYVLGGTPLLANSQSGALYPPHILFGLSGLPTGWAINLLAYFHLFVAGFGVFMLARRLGASEVGAAVGGVSFMLSPFMLGWAPLASVISTVAWIPWLLCGVASAVLPEEGEPELRPVGIMGLAGGMMVLAGHLQFVAYGFLAALLLALALRPKVRALVMVGLGHAIAGVIALPHLSAVLPYSQFSHRRNVASAEGYEAYIGGSIRPFELANLVNPVSLGNPRLKLQEASELSTYWPAFAKLGGNWAESAVAPGAIVILLLVFAPFVWSRFKGTVGEKSFLACGVVGLFSLLLATGTSLNRVLYFGVPGWSSTGSPGRSIVLFVLMACVAGALVEKHLRELGPKDRSFRLGLVAFILFSFLTLGLSTTGQTAALPQLAEPLKIAAAVAAGIALPITFLTILVAGQAPLLASLPAAKKYSTAIWVGLVPVLGILWGATSIVPSGTPFNVPRNESFEREAFTNRDWSLFGAAPNATNVPNLAIYARKMDIAGYDSLLHRDTKAMLDDLNGADSAPEANGNMMFVKPSADPAKLAEAGVGKLDGEPIPGPGRVSLSGGTAKITAQTLNTVTVEVSGPGTLTLRDRMMPGWTYSVDGGAAQPVPPSDRWRVVEVPSGAKTVTFRYEPSLFVGLVATAMIFLMAAFAMVRPIRPKLADKVGAERDQLGDAVDSEPAGIR
jgi:hypothetical protein